MLHHSYSTTVLSDMDTHTHTHTQISWSCCFNKIWAVWKSVKSRIKVPVFGHIKTNEFPQGVCVMAVPTGEIRLIKDLGARRKRRLMSGFRKILVVDRITLFIFFQRNSESWMCWIAWIFKFISFKQNLWSVFVCLCSIFCFKDPLKFLFSFWHFQRVAYF